MPIVGTLTVTDNFEDTVGINLISHIADSGETWARNATVSTGGAILTINETAGGDGLVIPNAASQTAWAYCSRIPIGSEYAIFMDFEIRSQNHGTPEIVGRSGTGAATGYRLAYSAENGTIILTVYNPAGGSATLGTYSFPRAANIGNHTLGLVITDAAKDVYLDPIDETVLEVETPIITSADNQITQIGRITIGNRVLSTLSNCTAKTAIRVYEPGAEFTPPSVPADLVGTAKIGAVDLDWSDSIDTGGAGLRGYRVEVSPASAGAWVEVSAPSAPPKRIASLTAGAAYDFRVRAEDNQGNLSAYSSTLTKTTTAAPAQPAPYNDLSGTSTGVTFDGAPILQSGDASASFNGTTGKVVIPYDPAMQVGGFCTLRAVIKPTTLPAGGVRRTLISRLGAYSLKQLGSGLEGKVTINSVTFTATASSGLVAGQIHDVAMVYDGSAIQLYINGTTAGSLSEATVGVVDPCDGVNLAIGATAAGAEFYSGLMAHAEVFAEPLSIARLAEDFLGVGEPPPPPDPGGPPDPDPNPEVPDISVASQIIQRYSIGNRFEVIVDATLGEYVTGGLPITAASCGLTEISYIHDAIARDTLGSVVLVTYVPETRTLVCLNEDTGVEILNTTDLSDYALLLCVKGR